MMYSYLSESGGLIELNPKHKKHIAAAFVYLSAKYCGERITMAKVCKDFGVTQELMRKSRKILEEILTPRS